MNCNNCGVVLIMKVEMKSGICVYCTLYKIFGIKYEFSSSENECD